MRPQVALLIVVALGASIIVGSVGFFLFQQLLARGLLLAGEQALEILQASPYPNLVVEVDWTQQDRPAQSALDVLQARLLLYTGKASVQIVPSDVIEVNRTVFSPLDLLEVERAHRDPAPTADTFTLYLLSLSGRLANGGDALGVAYTASSIAMFKDVIDGATTGPPGPSPAEVEAAVLVHEAGHLMGLVNLVYTSVLTYEDLPSHPFHSNDPNDVMYWAIESAPFGRPPDDFGPQTQFDLRKLRNGEYEIIPSRLRDLPLALGLVVSLDDRWAPSLSPVRWPET